MLRKVMREVRVFHDWTFGNGNRTYLRYSGETIHESTGRLFLGILVYLLAAAIAVIMTIQTILWIPSSVRLVGLVGLATVGLVKLATIYTRHTADIREARDKGVEPERRYWMP
jgi:purine-cytosine permease-like protein